MVQDFPGGGDFARLVSLVAGKNNNKSKSWLHLCCRKAGKEGEVKQVEWEFTNGTGIFQSFWLEWEKRNTSEDLHLFQKFPTGILGFWSQMVSAPYLTQL